MKPQLLQNLLLSLSLSFLSVLIPQISASPTQQLNGTQSVVQRASGFCKWDSDCYSQSGINSRCYTGRCICDLGYRPISQYCTKITCHYSSDCTAYQVLTRCDTFFNKCECVSGTYLDYSTQTCRYYSGGVGFSVGIPVGAIAFCVFVALLVCCCIRSRRARIQQARPILVAQPAQPRTTHIVLPPNQSSYMGPPATGYQNPNYYPQPQQQQYQQQPQPGNFPPPPPYNPSYQAPPTQSGPPTGPAPYPAKY